MRERGREKEGNSRGGGPLWSRRGVGCKGQWGAAWWKRQYDMYIVHGGRCRVLSSPQQCSLSQSPAPVEIGLNPLPPHPDLTDTCLSQSLDVSCLFLSHMTQAAAHRIL